MNASEIKAGRIYEVKISGRPVPFEVFDACVQGGWIGRNLKTRNVLHIRSEDRFRRDLTEETR